MKDKVWIRCPSCNAMVAMEITPPKGLVNVGLEWTPETCPPQLLVLLDQDQFYCEHCQYGAKISCKIEMDML